MPRCATLRVHAARHLPPALPAPRLRPPVQGASDVAYALFTFPSLAAYEEYRQGFGSDPDFLAADRIRQESGCVVRYERSFLRPVLDGDLNA